MDKVIPPGLNYADMKPEAIENQIRMVKFLPISNVMNQRPNDVIRFHLQGNGFYDPYSAYIKVRVSYDPALIGAPDAAVANELISGAFLDRSAHSLIQRLVIRSQGTELERIEHYDVMASMINDMIYSQEQRQLHSYEGFASKWGKQVDITTSPLTSGLNALQFSCSDNQEESQTHYGDKGFFRSIIKEDKVASDPRATLLNSTSFDPNFSFYGQRNGVPCSTTDFIIGSEQAKLELQATNAAIGWEKKILEDPAGTFGYYTSPMEMEFCIPIYSGIIGVLMPDKKLLPLSLLPLEVEFTVNPYAFYTVGNTNTRTGFTIKTFEIWTHTLFFEQELHRSLESVVAENGILLHYTSFYLTPINSYNVASLPKYHQLGCFLKSVEAIHWVFLYQNYMNDNGPRKLHFASHNIYNLQLRNGMDLIPSEPIPAAQNRSSTGSGAILGVHNQLLIETYKAWNKMHDTFTDGALNAFNFNLDGFDLALNKPLSWFDWLKQTKTLGRAQYGLSLVGEEIGQVKTIVSGKKTVLPFDLNFEGTKSAASPSLMLSYLRADFIIYVRPDLVVTRLGL